MLRPMARLPARLRTAWNVARGRPAQVARSRYPTAPITTGGIYNAVSGMGGAADKSEASHFYPTRLYTRYPLEVLCVQSWAAHKAVNMRVRDMFLRPRRFLDVSPEEGEAIEEALMAYRVDSAVHRAMVAARQYGTSLLVMMTRGADMASPMMPEQVREGDLTALRVLTRYDASVYERDYDLMSPTYGQPLSYNLHPNYGGPPMMVHHTRVVRFDGILDPGDSALTTYEQDWGVSILVPIVQSVLQEAGLAQAAAHLAQEASVPVLSVEGLRESMAGTAENEISPADIGEGINRMKSIFRILMLEKGTEEFTRVAVQFSGLADIMDRAARRVAAAVDVPFSRFMQDAPKGLNATGDGDFRNYVMTFEAERQTELPPKLKILDEVVFRSAGLGDVPEWEWPSLLELTEAESAEVRHKQVLALVEGINAGIFDEDEARAMIDGDEFFGELPGAAPGLPEPEIPAGPPLAKPPAAKPPPKKD